MDLSSFIVLIASFCLIKADFFSDLDKMDVDSQLAEIDKMMKTIDTDEEEAIDKLTDKKKDEDLDLGDAVEALAGLLGGGQCTYKCKNGKLY